MDIQLAHVENQKLLSQRNWLAVAVLLLLISMIWSTYALSSKNEHYILVPTLTGSASISNRSVSQDYLENITRDTAYLILNRTPTGLPYFRNAVLSIVDPSAYGRMKLELDAVVTTGSNSDLSQACIIKQLKVDTNALTSQVMCELRMYVGDREVSREPKIYNFIWRYQGLRLSLMDFKSELNPADKDKSIVAKAELGNR